MELDSNRAKIFLAIPSYGGVVGEGTLASFLHATKRALIHTVKVQGFSVLTHNFNILYSHALNARREGVTHFAMMHSDVVPAIDWLDRMMDLMNQHRADILSVIIPIKDQRGLTSTALDTDPWKPKRLSMREVFGYNPTFSSDNLLINTGLMLVDIRGDWAERVCFNFRDEIHKDAEGKFHAVMAPEDWEFARQARELGARIYATREVHVTHIGQAGYSNAFVWGSGE